MAIFGNMSITNAGQLLYAKAQTGKPIIFTRMQLGAGQIGTQNPATLLALVTPGKYVDISSITANTLAQTATVSGTINNSDVTVASYVCELGLWAKDPDLGEILYAYASAGTQGDYIASATQGAYSWNYQINAAVGNAANVTANISSLQYDYGIVISDVTNFTVISGGNQKSLNESIDSKFADNMLLVDDIKGTISYPVFVANQLNEIDHKIGSTVIRSDVFTYSTNLITEVRTIIATGRTLTFKFHKDTLQQEVI
ncbi:hypothetical protein [Clostridium estertheticum]|uniref:hypothetical protein n=1 Tax=Clostridium estertheticum TaxID=238834 RepID=UPI001C7D63F4|nr:hypothetical protein [Clostridium estertheticum]MBX4266528.1 hypothetical protein [Clostridium estertheticum]WLC88132.1 hypothetical protein KTC95_19255 [Clostridium estertheticum]